MRVLFAIEGGMAYFPGLSRPMVLDSDDMPEADAAELERLLDEVDFFALPAASHTMPKGAADYRQYTMTVEQGQRHHTVRAFDPITDPCLNALVEFLRRHARPAANDDAGAYPGKRANRRSEKALGDAMHDD